MKPRRFHLSQIFFQSSVSMVGITPFVLFAINPGEATLSRFANLPVEFTNVDATSPVRKKQEVYVS
ncbi:hypothetical protein LguiA_025274 [Lonicera macranthoides]